MIEIQGHRLRFVQMDNVDQVIEECLNFLIQQGHRPGPKGLIHPGDEQQGRLLTCSSQMGYNLSDRRMKAFDNHQLEQEDHR